MTIKDWKSTLIPPDTSILKAIEVINDSSLQVSLVVEKGNRLLGMVTDGDIRRAILRNIPLTDPVEGIMSKDITIANVNDSRESIIVLMQRKDLRHVPIVDDMGCIVDLKVLIHLIEEPHMRLDNLVVLMAGGLGSRLLPLTEKSPKPLLEVGGKPLLETIIQNFMGYGFYRFSISINYKAEMIIKHFGDGSKWGIEISYLREKTKLGTAGALSILKDKPNKPVLVMNSDLLTKVNFRQLLDFHIQNKSSATMCVKEYDLKVPYGVVNVNGSQLVDLQEKPVHNFFVNAGIYVLEPEVLSLIPEDTRFDITTLFNKLLNLKYKTVTFPIHEYWLDIGKKGDYEKANGEYREYFE